MPNSIYYDAVLEALNKAKEPASTKAIAKLAGITPSDVQIPLRQLIEDYKAIKFGNGFYQIASEFRTAGQDHPDVFADKDVEAARKKTGTKSRTVSKSGTANKPVNNTEQKEEKPVTGEIKTASDTDHAVLAAVDDLINEINEPDVEIPELGDAELKLEILKKLVHGVNSTELSVHLEELRVWVRDVLMLS